ncbi:MAG: TlpA disulfide reductase family protein [bacterium]
MPATRPGETAEEALAAGDAPAADGSSDGGGRARRQALAFILVPLLFTLIWAGAVRLTREPLVREDLPRVAKGLPAPDFTFPLLGGGASSLSEHRGKVVAINIWATWCPPCIEEMPSLQNLYVEMKRRGRPFEILAVSIDALGGDPVEKWVERFGLTFPILLDPRGKIKKLYRTTGVPETFIIDPKGRLVEKVIGARKWDSPEISAFIEQILQLDAAEKTGS